MIYVPLYFVRSYSLSIFPKESVKLVKSVSLFSKAA